MAAGLLTAAAADCVLLHLSAAGLSDLAGDTVGRYWLLPGLAEVRPMPTPTAAVNAGTGAEDGLAAATVGTAAVTPAGAGAADEAAAGVGAGAAAAVEARLGAGASVLFLWCLMDPALELLGLVAGTRGTSALPG